MDTVKRIGMADCHGIAEYHEYNSSTLTILCMRASCNSHKRAVAFELEITPGNDDAVMKLLNKGEYELALRFLKGVAINLKASGANHKSQTYWNQIPNPVLDPSLN